MTIALFDNLVRALTPVASRRGLLATLTGGALTALPLGVAGAKPKHGKRRHKHKRKHKQKHKQGVVPLPPAPPTPVVRVDATCTGSGQRFIATTNGNARAAQTFVALTSGWLVSTEIPTVKEPGSNGDYILRLSPVDNSGVPTNVVLAESSVANASVPDGESTLTFTFANPASLLVGTQYALLLTRPGDGPLAWAGQLDNPCQGRAFESPDQTAPFGGEGAEFLDLFFTTFVLS
jgi:hypothetical protein